MTGTALDNRNGCNLPEVDMKKSCTAIFVICVSLVITASPATAHEPPRLVEYLSDSEWSADSLSADQAATLESIRSDPAAIDVRIGQAYPDAVRSARALSLVVPASQSVDLAPTVSFHDLEIELRSEQDYSLYARDETSGSEVSLVVLGTDVLGTIRHDANVYKVHPLGGGLTAVYRYDSSALEESSGGAAEAVEAQGRDFASSMDSGPPPSPPVASGDAMPVIDILVVYTRRARAEAGNIGVLIRHAIEQTNQIYANSQIRARVRLAYSYQTEYAEVDGGDISIDWSRLRSTGDRYMDEVHAVRDQHGADLVVLLRARHNSYWCQYASLYGGNNPVFSVVERNCIGNYSFAQAVGLNQGVSRDLQFRPNSRFPHGHAFCNDLGNWRTLMSWNPDRRCPVRQPYFSNPDVSFMGSPTGDAHTRNNARVIDETAPLIANYRRAPQSPHSVPLVTSADNESRQGFVRVINRSEHDGTVRIHAIDDEGWRRGPVELSLDPKQTRHFNSGDLENGNPGKGLSGGVGDGTGNWRLELETELDIEVLAYIRTPDGFLTSIHDAAAQADDGSMRHHVSIFNPGKNTDQQSLLRLINLGGDAADIEISGLDDKGNAPPGGSVRLTLAPGAAHLLTAQELEQGSDDFSDGFSAGSGKWQLFVTADQPIQVMSLLLSPTGNLTNLSQ